MNTSEFLEEYSGQFTGALVTIYSTETFFGFIFNLLILSLNAKWWKKTKITTGHILITNLHLVDLFICLTALPTTIAIVSTGRRQSVLTCTLHESFLSFASAGSSAALLFTTFDRYDAVINPFNRKIKIRNLKVILASIWVLATIAVLMPFMVIIDIEMNGIYFKGKSEIMPCIFLINKSNAGFYFVLFYVVLYTVANIIMIVCYHKILKVARTRINVKSALVNATMMNSLSDDPQQAMTKQKERKLTLICLAIVTVFMVCWGPHTVLSIILVANRQSSIHLEMIYLCSLALAYLTTCLHPLVYAFMRKQFRDTISAAWFNHTSNNAPEVQIAVSHASGSERHHVS